MALEDGYFVVGSLWISRADNAMVQGLQEWGKSLRTGVSQVGLSFVGLSTLVYRVWLSPTSVAS